MKTRAEALAQLEAGQSGDILIVGGGINGVGLLRDLAAQGVGATLVEAADFSSGTSAAPSRLIHGGIRYLEQGEFKLVRESVEERDRLLRNAPHQVKPLRVWVPAASWTAGTFGAALRFIRLRRDPGPKGALILKLGLAFYDAFSGRNHPMPRHRLVKAGEAAKAMPRLRKDVKIVAEYYDARVESPERLAVELVADAERDCPHAVAVPYLSLQGLDGTCAILRDELTGRTITKHCRLIVNCAGAWIDTVDAALGIRERLVGGTRGSHLVLDRPDLADELGDVMLYFETPDHRACLAYRLDARHVLLGTTDLRTDDPDDKTATDAEIDYLFEVLQSVMPGLSLHREDIAFAYSGVRPLPHTASGAAGAISRDHAHRTFEPTETRAVPVLTLIGGKWTTYRACAEQLADAVLGRLSMKRKRSTIAMPVGGGRDFPVGDTARSAMEAEIAAAARVPAARAAQLLARYGTLARDLAPVLAAEGDTPLPSAPAYSRQEIGWLTRTERVSQLDDVILRRTLIAFEGLASRGTIEEVAAVMAPILGWSAEQVRLQVARMLDLLATRHRVPGAAQGALAGSAV